MKCSQSSFPTPISSPRHLNYRGFMVPCLRVGSIWFLLIITAGCHLLSHISSHLLCRFQLMQGAVGMSHASDYRSPPAPAFHHLLPSIYQPLQMFSCCHLLDWDVGNSVNSLGTTKDSLTLLCSSQVHRTFFSVRCRTCQFPTMYCVAGGYTSVLLDFQMKFMDSSILPVPNELGGKGYGARTFSQIFLYFFFSS